MYPRRVAPFIAELLNEFRIIYLTGPRQAGKTTLVRALAMETDMEYLSLDQQTVLEAAVQDPFGFIQSLEDRRAVLDEFQYAPELIPALKAASDNLPPGTTGKFLLTGSADIFRSAKVQEALPGHMARLELYPLSVGEITGQARNLIDFLMAPGFPSTKAPPQPAPEKREQWAKRILVGGLSGSAKQRPPCSANLV